MDGKRVPIELSLALHSDAGYNPDGQSTWGALAICTTDFNDGMLNSGISRFASKDFAKALRDNLVEDMTNTFGSFGKRYLWDRNYSETRLPEVPSAIIEMLSHQSFPDMRIAQDPMGKFTIARSIYKTILRFVSSNHDEPYVVQPLAPNHFSVEVDELGYASLTWNAQLDKTEPTAKPTSYIVYQAEGKGGFDNGTMVRSNIYNVKLEPGKLYNFRVAAVNQGGESFPSETLSALYNPTATNKILIVNNFHRLASPQVVDNDSIQGFDFDQDPGVSYGLTAGWSGKQKVFDIHRMGIESSSGLGYSGNEMIGQFVAGNDFNHTVEHAQAIASGNKYSIASCSSEAILSGRVKMTDYQAVDLINGLERYDGYTHQYYKTFTPAMQKRIKYYALNGGKLLVSGSYNGSDMQDEEEKSFMGAILKVNYEPTGTKFIVQDVNPEDSTITERDSIVTTSPTVSGLGKEFSYYHSLNAKHYAATHPEILKPIGSTAFCAMRYLTGTSAAVAYRSTSYRTFTMGFPLECISDEKTSYSIMQGILKFLTE